MARIEYGSDKHKALMAMRRAAGKLIEPATAIIHMEWHVTAGDEYGDGIRCDSGYSFKKQWFARDPDLDVWVWFDDLPAATRKAIYALMDSDYYENRALVEIGLFDDIDDAEAWRRR
jgi:hypothetical protein